MDHLGNVYSASLTVTLDEQQTNNGVTEADGTIHRPVSLTLSKEELGRDPSLLQNTWKGLLNKNQEEGDFNWHGKDKEVIIEHFSSQVCEQILGKPSLTNISRIKGKLLFNLGIF